MKALLYIDTLRMINMLFVEQICCQINFFSKIFRRFFFVEETFDHMPGSEHRYADMGRTLETLDTATQWYSR